MSNAIIFTTANGQTFTTDETGTLTPVSAVEAHQHYQPQIEDCMREINQLRAYAELIRTPAERLVRTMTDWMADDPKTRFEVVDDAYRALRDALTKNPQEGAGSTPARSQRPGGTGAGFESPDVARGAEGAAGTAVKATAESVAGATDSRHQSCTQPAYVSELEQRAKEGASAIAHLLEAIKECNAREDLKGDLQMHLRSKMTAAEDAHYGLVEILELPNVAVQASRHQVSNDAEVEQIVRALRRGEQADPDGVFVKVSRQACEEAAEILERDHSRHVAGKKS